MIARTAHMTFPYFAADDEGAGGTGAEGENKGGTEDTGAGDKGGDGDKGSAGSASDAFAALDEDTRGWLQTKGIADAAALAKSAREAEKMLGDRIKVPGKDATPEERDAFFSKLGRPEKPEGYEFAAPKDMPEGLPYDGERAGKLKEAAHKIGLTPEQAKAMHDLYVQDQIETFGALGEHKKGEMAAKAKAETDKLIEAWGPLNGEKAQANLELADRAFNDIPGGQEFLAELQSLGLVGEDKTVFSAATAKFLAGIGSAFFKEGELLRGSRDQVGNPFAEGDGFNLTEAGKIVKNDPDRARQLITAAGKKPEDFGLKSGA